jgi:hypothetical protein
VLWAPDGKKFVFNKLDTNSTEKDSKLWLGDIVNASDQPLDLEGSAERAAFDGGQKSLYIATRGAKGDSLWKINLSNFEKTELFRSNDKEKIQATELLVSEDGTQLYFKNSDGFLYGLDVK